MSAKADIYDVYTVHDTLRTACRYCKMTTAVHEQFYSDTVQCAPRERNRIRCFIRCLHDPANVRLHYNIWQQTSSITFAGSLLDVCWIV